jgi:hypothetical protein
MKMSSIFGMCVFALWAVTPGEADAGDPDVRLPSRHDTSLPLSTLAVGGSTSSNQGDAQTPSARATRGPLSNPKNDSVASTFTGSLSGVTPGLSFDGQSAADNRAVFGFAFVPPDTNGAVGATQFVQMVNVTISVYDKATGSQVLPPTAIHTLWKGFGGLCENGGGTPTFADGGDPVVLYDHLAGRWLVTQLQFDPTFTQTAECVAVSTSSDATGSYNRYEFDFGSDFPDYPKYGVWPDAYYNSINVFPPKSFAGARACALDRARMLQGANASMICFQQPPTVSSLLPSDLDGRTLPPAGAPNYFVGLADSTHLNLFQFHVDFAIPANSTFGPATLVPVAPFSEICARAQNVSCVPQPTPGERVDALADRVMFRLAYRNFGDHESLVVNHTVRGGPLAAVRWYEIRSPGANPFVFQQATLFDPDLNFWLGSVAMDQVGNLALGFSASSLNLFPSIYVGGRAPNDPPGTLSGPLVLVNGTGSQFSSFHRWGDYSAMTVDPSDDCTFWYTNEYYRTTSSFNWSTRIGSFKFDSCRARPAPRP